MQTTNNCHRCGRKWTTLRRAGMLIIGYCDPCGISLQSMIQTRAAPSGSKTDLSAIMPAWQRRDFWRKKEAKKNRSATAAQCAQLRQLIKDGKSQRIAANIVGISKSQAQRILSTIL